MSPRNNTALIGLMGAVCVVLGMMENFIPVPIPGVRLGLANTGIMLMLYLGSVRQAFMVMLIKIIILPLLSGNFFFRMILSGPAGIISFIIMSICLIFLTRYCTPLTIGVLGASSHMLTQLYIMDSLYIKGLLSTSLTGWLLLAALGTGLLTGTITSLILKRIEKIYHPKQ